MISDRIKPARMFTESMDDANRSGGVGRGKLGVIEPNLFLLSVEIGFEDAIMMLFRLANEFFVHLNK